MPPKTSTSKFALPLVFCMVGTGVGYGLAQVIWSDEQAPAATGSGNAAGSATAVKARVPAPEVAPETKKEAEEEGKDAPTPEAKPTREQLKAALADKDIFRGAKGALAWIERATVEDFRAFAKDPKRYPRSYFAGFDDDFQKVFVGALLERWLTLAPEDIVLVPKLTDDMGRFMMMLGRAKPELVLAQFKGGEISGPLARASTDALQALAERDLPAARKFLETISDPELRKSHESAILIGMAKNDVHGALALLPLPDPAKPYMHSQVVEAIMKAAEAVGPGELRMVFAEGGKKLEGYSRLAQLALRYPGFATELAGRTPPEGQGAWVAGPLLQEAERMPAGRRAELLAGYDQLPPLGRDAICTALVSAWAMTEPRAAVEWALAHGHKDDPKAPANLAAQYGFTRWMIKDPAGALTWWQALPPSPARDAMGVEASTRVAENGDFEQALKMYRPLEGFQPATDHLASLYVKRDPVAAAQWLGQAPANATGQYAVGIVTSAYYQRDPEGASAWAAALPEGPMRDQAAQKLAYGLGHSKPEEAAGWVGKISDPAKRGLAAQNLAVQWGYKDKEAARAWAAASPDLDEKGRAKVKPKP